MPRRKRSVNMENVTQNTNIVVPTIVETPVIVATQSKRAADTVTVKNTCLMRTEITVVNEKGELKDYSLNPSEVITIPSFDGLLPQLSRFINKQTIKILENE
jgi:hypothetical protein